LTINLSDIVQKYKLSSGFRGIVFYNKKYNLNMFLLTLECLPKTNINKNSYLILEYNNY